MTRDYLKEAQSRRAMRVLRNSRILREKTVTCCVVGCGAIVPRGRTHCDEHSTKHALTDGWKPRQLEGANGRWGR